MLSELFYYYDAEEQNILPFLIAPVSSSQDNLIFAPKYLAVGGKNFISKVFEIFPSVVLSEPHIRVFSYNNDVIVVLFIPSTAREPESGRSGLCLVLGVSIKKFVFQDYQNPINSFFKIFIKQINTVFNLDILNGGTDEIISSIVSDNSDLNKNCRLVCNTLINTTLYMRPTNIISRLLFTIKRHRKRNILPKVIIHNQPFNKVLYFLLLEVDFYLTNLSVLSSFGDIDFSIGVLDCGYNENSTLVLKLGYSISNKKLSKATISHINEQTYISLW